jgi:hypothetical protein
MVYCKDTTFANTSMLSHKHRIDRMPLRITSAQAHYFRIEIVRMLALPVGIVTET